MSVMLLLQAFRLGGGLNKLLALLRCPTDPAIQQAGAAGPAPAAAADSQPQQQQEDAEEQQQQQQRQRRLRRKVLALLQYVLAKHPTDGFAAAEFGLVPQLQALLSTESDSDMRCASLAVLSEVVATPQGWQWVRQHQAGLLPCLQQQQQAGEEVDEEEQQLLQKLVGALQSDSLPQEGAAGLRDHIELDPQQVSSCGQQERMDETGFPTGRYRGRPGCRGFILNAFGLLYCQILWRGRK